MSWANRYKQRLQESIQIEITPRQRSKVSLRESSSRYFQKVKTENFGSDNLAPLLMPSVYRKQPTKYKMTLIVRTRRLCTSITQLITILKKKLCLQSSKNMCLGINVKTIFMIDSCYKGFRSNRIPNEKVWRTHFHFQSNLYVQFLLHYLRNESATLAVILESTLVTFCHRHCQYHLIILSSI